MCVTVLATETNTLAAEDYEPGLIDLYKSELERVKRVYQERADVYEAYEKWLSLWRERLEFEARANDPDRYRSRTLQQEILVCFGVFALS